MANLLDELLKLSGQFTGQVMRTGGNIPAAMGNMAGQAGFNLGQQVTQGMVNNLPPIALEEGKKVLKKFYAGMAEQTVMQPNGAEILAQAIGEFPQPSPQQPTPKQGESKVEGQSKQETPQAAPQPNFNQAFARTVQPQAQYDQYGQFSNALGQLLMSMSEGARGLQPGTIRMAEQEISGQKPLQKGEREKMEMDFQKTILSETIKASQQGLLKPDDLLSKYEMAIKPWEIVRDAHQRVENSAKDPSAAGDLALIFNFLKVLDSGSTVREGEVANAQNSAGVPERIRAIYNRVLSGKRLSSTQRADFLDRSRRLMKGAEEQTSKTVSEFHKLAEQNNLDPKRIFRDVGFANSEQPETNKTPSGNTFRRL